MSFFDKLSKLLPFSNKQENIEYYFGLNIEPDRVEASIWGIQHKRLHIINTSSKKYESKDELVDAANFALDNALADFEYEPSKILFGVPDAWLQDEDLKPEYLKKLRELTKELDVSPMAYVSITHAISHLLQKLEGVPLTAILVDVSDPLVVTVVKAGKVMGSKSARRTGNLPEDIEKSLLKFNDIEVLPSKILIYGPSDTGLEKYKQELLSYSWMAQLPFLHLPRVDALDEDIAIKAISFAGASELNPDIDVHPQDLEAKSKEKIYKVSHSMPMDDERSNLEDVGFVAGDINEKESTEEKRDEEERAVEEREVVLRPRPSYSAGIEDDHYPVSNMKPELGFLLSIKSKFSGTLKRLMNLQLLVVPVLVLILIAGAIIFLPKALVTVFVDPRTLEKDATIIADPAIKAIDEPNKKIPGKTVETEVSGSSKGTASGKKQVGDPARGSVVIYNKTSAQKTLSTGTVLVGPSNLTFSLDSTVNIASQSAVEGGISFGKATAKVTASSIGPDGNLPAGKELTVKGVSSSDVNAKVDTAFSGGVSKDVTVVNSDDQKKLLAALSADLRKQAAEALQGKLSGDSKILPEGLSEKIIKQNFSKNVNDQASEFSLNLTVSFKGTAYSDNDLKLIVSKLVETNVPEGYTLDLSKTETQADVAKIEKDGKLIFNAKFRAKLMPKLNTDKIRKQITFKTPAEVDSILKTYENVIGGEVRLTPSLPGPFARLPIMAKNITVEISTK